jgi:hypothetical protein
MRRSLSSPLSVLAPIALALASSACAGATMLVDTSDADTVDEGGSDDDDDGDDDDGDDDDSSPTSADDDGDDDTQTGADADPSDDGDAGSSDDGEGDETSSAASADATTDASTTLDDAGTTGGGEATSGESSSDGGEPGMVDLSGFILLQTDSAREITIPDGTIVPVGGAILIGRDASLGQFEDFWGVTLDDAVYIDGGDVFPACNGDETFSLLTPLRTVVDGPTPALVLSTSIERTDASADASEAAAWTSSATPNTDATPGTGLADGGDTGVPYIAEIVDATGPGNFPFEFVEIRVAP